MVMMVWSAWREGVPLALHGGDALHDADAGAMLLAQSPRRLALADEYGRASALLLPKNLVAQVG
eukprot:COSAG01_NODE_22121_length_870_cov_64.180285_2_plen_64_part_00